MALPPAGGWHPDDHAEFERILRACRGNYAHCVQLCSEELSLLHSADDVQRHARWHEELQRLQLSKRLAVQRWRTQRQAQQAALLEQQQQQLWTGQLAEVGQQEREAAEERERHRAALADWKAAREERRVEERRQHEAEQQKRRERELLARQRRQQENRQLLEQRRQGKGAADGQSQHEAPSAESSRGSSVGSAPLDPAARQRLRHRSQQLLQRRAVQTARRGELAAQQAARVEALQRAASQQFGGAAERDPRRLQQATAAAAMRQLAALSEERAPKDSGYIRHLPRRATPSWCGGARLQ